MSLRKGLLLAALLGSTLISSVASATDFTTAIAGRVFCDENCNRRIDVGVDEQLMKVTVQLLDENGNVLQTTTPEVFGGTYIFGDLVAGKKYYVRVVPGIGQEVVQSFPSLNATRVSSTVISAIVVVQNETYYPNDFLLSCGSKTWNACEWGKDTCYKDPIDVLESRFAQLFPNGVVIGGTKILTFTSASAILRFLPAANNPRKLIMSRTNPLYNSESELAGNVLALVLNLKMSENGLTGEGLGDNEIGTGPFTGLSLDEFAALANRVLGGETNLLPYGVTIYDLNRWVEWANDRDWSDDCSCGCGSSNNHQYSCKRSRNDCDRDRSRTRRRYRRGC